MPMSNASLLDEATAAVDNETEAAIQRSLDQITAQRTTLVIAHRLSTVRHADRIVVMEQGRIVETGQHDQLIQAGGAYANLWRVQAGLRPGEALGI
jgi:ATP-binding cassette subfamily B protein